MRILHSRLMKIICFTGATALALVLLVNIWVLCRSSSHIVDDVDQLPKVEAVMILGARVYNNGQLSPMLLDRAQTALDVYKAGKADVILISGDHGQAGYDEVNAIKDYLLEQGVVGEDVFLDHAGFDTYDSVYRAKHVFQVTSVIIATQSFHLSRAVYVGQALGIETTGISADRQPYRGIVLNHVRELAARVKTYIRVILHSKPVYLGEPIPITGSSFDSWDELYEPKND